MILAARDLGDRQPSQDAGAEQFEVGAALVDGAQPGTFAAQILVADRPQRVALGRPLLLARALLGGARIAAALGLAQRLGGPLARRRQRQRRVELGRGVGFGHAALDQARPKRQLALQAPKPEPDDEDFLRRLGNTTTRSPAQPGSETS